MGTGPYQEYRQHSNPYPATIALRTDVEVIKAVLEDIQNHMRKFAKRLSTLPRDVDDYRQDQMVQEGSTPNEIPGICSNKKESRSKVGRILPERSGRHVPDFGDSSSDHSKSSTSEKGKTSRKI